MPFDPFTKFHNPIQNPDLATLVDFATKFPKFWTIVHLQFNRQCNKLIQTSLKQKYSAVLGHFWAWRRIPVTMAATRRKMVKLEVVLVTKFIVEAILIFQRVLKLHQHFCNQERRGWTWDAHVRSNIGLQVNSETISKLPTWDKTRADTSSQVFTNNSC